jgi:hypothetical protein
MGWKAIIAIIVGALFVAGLGFWACLRQTSEQRQALRPTQLETLRNANARASRIDTLVVTKRGNRLHGDRWASSDVAQTKVPGEVVDAVVQREGNRVKLNVGAHPDSLTEVSMDASSPHEGQLFRIHVDRPGKGMDDESDRIIVIGFYDRLWSAAAVDSQAVNCYECNGMTVCGSKPRC